MPDFKYLLSAADAENWPTDSADVYIRMGQVGPRTLLKWRMRGMRLVRNRVSTMTAALVVSVPLKASLSNMILSEGFDFNFPSLTAADSVVDALVDVEADACCEYRLIIVVWGKHNLAVQMKRRMMKAERRIFRDLRRRSSVEVRKAMVSHPLTHAVLRSCVV